MLGEGGTYMQPETQDFIVGKKSKYKGKAKTGRKTGFRMQAWQKQLIQSRADCIELEKSNAILQKLGDIISSNVNTLFEIDGKQMKLLGCNMRLPSNLRTFLFQHEDFGWKENFDTQFLYDGILNGTVIPQDIFLQKEVFRLLIQHAPYYLKEKALHMWQETQIVLCEKPQQLFFFQVEEEAN
jgi:hypothetical protein